MKTLTTTLLLALSAAWMAGCGPEKNDYLDRMADEHRGDSPVANASADADAPAEVDTRTVTYATVEGTEVQGYLAEPEGADGELPGLIVIHEWWGLNDNIRMMTRRLADRGYRALAVDLYNGESADTPDGAGRLARQAGENPERAIDNLEQAHAYLTGELGATSVGTIGWCFGGGWSLRASLAMPQQVDATVIYYGRLVTDAQELSALTSPVLGIFGEEDGGIPPEEVRAFEAALNEAEVPNDIHIYEGAGHAFANPSGNRYVEEAAEDAWQKTTAFLEANLK